MSQQLNNLQYYVHMRIVESNLVVWPMSVHMDGVIGATPFLLRKDTIAMAFMKHDVSFGEVRLMLEDGQIVLCIVAHLFSKTRIIS